VRSLLPYDRVTVKRRIRKDEGIRYRPYKDSEGILTVGVGRNLEAVEFRANEVELMFENDFSDAEEQASTLACWSKLNPPRQGVLVEMTFRLGFNGLRKFKKMLAALTRRDYTEACVQVLDSKMASRDAELGSRRSEDWAEILRSGTWTT